MKVSKGSNQKQQRKSGDTIFPIISLWGYFLDAQGQLTLQSVGRSGRNSNSSEILWMSSLPTNLKWILSTATKKEWQHQFFRHSRAANSQVSSGIWPKFEFIQALMHVPITCKYRKDRTLNSQDKVETPSFPL